VQHDLLALSGERDVQLGLRLRAYRDGWKAGHMTGTGDGRQAEAAERDAEWNAIARPAARGHPAHAEFERQRWALRGERRTRETFAGPHPGDYPGQDGPA
jgi:hypothetical protein